MIPLSTLEKMFADMRARTSWNIDGRLLWGYFFTDPEANKVKMAAQRLSQLGYQFVTIRQADNRSTHVLHVERIETHSPKSLHERNTDFESLAKEFDLASYDGMDVGLAPPTAADPNL